MQALPEEIGSTGRPEVGGKLVVSRRARAKGFVDAIQWLRIEPTPAVITRSLGDGLELETLAEVVDEEGGSAWSRVLHEALDTVGEAAREGLLTPPRPRGTTRPE